MGAFHKDLRRAYLIPRFSVGNRTLRILRMSARPMASTDQVTISEQHVPGPDGQVLLRIYRPTDATAPTPVLFWVHGGGLIFGSPQQDDRTNIAFAQTLGITVVAVTYRMAPENEGPAAIDDVYAGYLGMLARTLEFNIDPERIAIAGASAGGGLAAVLAQRIKDTGVQAPVFQLLVYPMLDDRTALRTGLDERHMRGWTPKSNRYAWTVYLGAEPGSADLPPYLVAARREDLSGLPPAWIGVGTLDLFHDEDLEYAERLRAAGVPCEVTVIDGAFHGFDAMVAKAPVSQQFWQTQADQIARHLLS